MEKYSTGTLTEIIEAFKGYNAVSILILHNIIPCFSSKAWVVRESRILALGAVTEGKAINVYFSNDTS